MIWTLFLLLADPTAAGQLLPASARWPALTACVRVSSGEDVGAVAAAACIGQRDGFAYLLTASHAVPKGEARVFEFFTAKSYPRPVRTVIGFEEVVRLAVPDVALVRVKLGTETLPVVRLGGPGQRPKRFPVEGRSIGCPDGSPPVFRAEQITGKKLVRLKGGGEAFFWELARAPTGGMSGGPLLDAAGQVIGVCTAAQDGRGYYAHLDEILAGLKIGGAGWLFEPAGREP